jgi:hypothetical protein
MFAVAIAATTACDFPTGEYCEGTVAAAPVEAEPPERQSLVVAQVLPAEYTAVDVLFVIDDSRSMMDEQEQLAIWSSELFDVLSLSGELADLHVAVISSSVSIPGLEGCEYAGDGAFHVGGAALQGDRFIRDVAGELARERNYEGTLTQTFAEMARVGDDGCGFEQPFEATRLALAGSVPGTEEFLRDEALLLVVFVTDEDDCSASDPSLYSDPYADACSALGPRTSYRCFEHGVRCYDGKASRVFGARENCRADEDSPYVDSVSSFARHLRSLKAHPAQVVVAGIYGKPHQVATVRDEQITAYAAPRLANVCDTGGDEGTGATPAVRMNALMTEFPARASQSSICAADLSWALRDAGLAARAAASRSHCLRGSLVDIDTAAPGVQPSCRVDVISNAGTAQEAQLELPACDGTGGARCFTIDVDALACPDTDTQLAFAVSDGAANETLTATCDVAPPPL